MIEILVTVLAIVAALLIAAFLLVEIATGIALLYCVWADLYRWFTQGKLEEEAE